MRRILAVSEDARKQCAGDTSLDGSCHARRTGRAMNVTRRSRPVSETPLIDRIRALAGLGRCARVLLGIRGGTKKKQRGRRQHGQVQPRIHDILIPDASPPRPQLADS
jgi:hypothetical protein